MVPKTPSPAKACTIPECGKKLYARGWCGMHYQRWRNHGDPRRNLISEMPSACSVDDCKRAVLARGLCQLHYARQSRTGSPTGSTAALKESRFWKKVRKTGSCWTWEAALNPGGYGTFGLGGKTYLSHRVSYEWANGSIDPRLDIDHICRNRACVNPDHLRQATRKQNVENHSGASRASKSGVRGVWWHPASGKWRGVVMHGSKTYQVGMFTLLSDAEVAVTAKRIELHTHNDLDRAMV